MDGGHAAGQAAPLNAKPGAKNAAKFAMPRVSSQASPALHYCTSLAPHYSHLPTQRAHHSLAVGTRNNLRLHRKNIHHNLSTLPTGN